MSQTSTLRSKLFAIWPRK